MVRRLSLRVVRHMRALYTAVSTYRVPVSNGVTDSERAVNTEQSEVPSTGALVVLFDQHPEPPQFQADAGYDTKCRSRW